MKRVSINQTFRRSPARIMGIQNRFIRQINRRFGDLMRDVRLSILDRDCFGIQPDRLIMVLEPTRARQYAFMTAPDKVANFMTWLDEQEERKILEIIRRPGRRPGIYPAWTDTYIDSAYQQGIRRSRAELRRTRYDIPLLEVQPGGMSVIMNQPIHADRVGMIYSRTYDDLRTVTQVANAQVRRKLADGLTTGLAQGMAEGKHPTVIARELVKDVNNRLDKIGRVRARMIARTETARAHHVAMIAEYKNAAEDMEVEIMAEWVTAGFEVCPICLDLEADGPYRLEQVEGMLPAHPNCRCVVIPKKRRLKSAQVMDGWDRARMLNAV